MWIFTFFVFYFFFFSSRRRHTRFDCDWSSDVCSSDLATALLRRAFLAYRTNPWPDPETMHDAFEVAIEVAKTSRSEEHTSELQSQSNLVCRLLLEKKNKK